MLEGMVVLNTNCIPINKSIRVYTLKRLIITLFILRYLAKHELMDRSKCINVI